MLFSSSINLFFVSVFMQGRLYNTQPTLCSGEVSQNVALYNETRLPPSGWYAMQTLTVGKGFTVP